jgi:hypothetical protein
MIDAPSFVEEAGLIGTILAGYYVTVKILVKYIISREAAHSDFVENLLSRDSDDRALDREERVQDREEHASDRKEHKKSYDKLSHSLEQLAIELRKDK